MNLAKVSANGQITVPLEVRRALNLKPGDKVLFVQNQEGQITISNRRLQGISLNSFRHHPITILI